jgi:polyisoprenoid-binding protein YceI
VGPGPVNLAADERVLIAVASSIEDPEIQILPKKTFHIGYDRSPNIEPRQPCEGRRIEGLGIIAVVSQGALMNRILLASVAALASATALAAPVTYVLDPAHTYPSFSADHMGGLSVWRGKFDQTSGKVVYDKDAKSGSIDITVDVKSIDFGMAKMNEHATSADIFDAAKYPTATYTGKFSKFDGATPTEAQGTLTLHGVTKPVTLTINSFMCKPNPMTKKEVCGADASATINRSDFGVSYGDAYGFKMGVKLEIQVEGSPAG